MENNFNIEELFRNNLEHAEAQPPAGAWEAIQAKIGAGAAASGAGTAATGLGIGKIAAIVAVTLGVGLGVGYLALRDNGQESKTNNNQPVQEITNNHTETTVPAKEEQVEITNISSAQKADKIVSIVETKKGEQKKTIRVEEPVQVDKNGSIVNQWLTPEKEKAKAEQMMQRIIEEVNKNKKSNADVISTDVPTKDKQIVVSTVDNTHIEVGINAEMDVENALTVNFSNLTEGSSYEWSFGDGTNSKQASPTHVYQGPGLYTVTLKIYDKSGKMYSGVRKIELQKTNEDFSTKSALTGEIPNVFTPNGDGNNDFVHFSAQNIGSFVFIVLKGDKTVFTSNDPDMYWNGNDNSGNPLPSGNYTYFYKAIGKDNQPYHGASQLTITR